jgi:hypothetical protein
MKEKSDLWMQLREFDRVQRSIRAIHLALGILATFYLASTFKTILEADLWAAITALEPLAFIASASLVTFVAHRQIIHTNVIREADHHANVVRVTHHLIAIVSDLRTRIQYTQTKLYDEKTVPVVLRSNAQTISNRFEQLYERDNFEHLSPEATRAIHDLSGAIFGLTALMQELAAMRERNPDPAYIASHILPMALQSKQATTFETMVTDLNRLEDDLRQLRSTIEQKKS